MSYHEPGNKEKQTKLPFRLPSSTRAGHVMGKQGYTRKGKYPEDFEDEDVDSTDQIEEDIV